MDESPQLIFLGTGTSVGVPALGCSCQVCTSDHPRNQRTRSSVVLELPQGKLLIDASPDLRTQLLREKISLLHSVVFTHAHADHLHGLDDVRLFPFQLGHAIPIYCEPSVRQRIERVFDYAFLPGDDLHVGAVPKLALHTISTEPFEVLGSVLRPIRLLHGQLPVLGFRVGNVAYCTDVSEIPPESWPLLADLDVLILDALRLRPHPTHLSLEQALAVVTQFQPRQTYFTHLSHELEYATSPEYLPRGVELAYDGLRIPLG